MEDEFSKSTHDDVTAALAERALAIGYAPASRRAGLAALFALDTRLGEILRATRQPLAGQLRLAWWRDALAALDTGPAPAEPVLATLAREVLPWGVRGGDLAAISEGWEQLVEPLGVDAVAGFATKRGAILFDQAALLLTGRSCDVAAAGEGWALADLAGWARDPVVAGRAWSLAQVRLRSVSGPWPRALRPLGALVLLARSDLAGGAPASPSRVGRLFLHRLTGR